MKINLRTSKFKKILMACMITTLILLLETSYAATYNVSTIDDLNQISTNVANGQTYNGDTINLMTDIFLNGSSTNKFVPIGNATYAFAGTFEGNEHTISGLYVSSASHYNGLFGKISSSAIVRNLTVSGNVSGKQYTAGIVGYSLGQIENCINKCSVTGTDNVGGVVGFYGNGSISNSSNAGVIIGSDYVGGIIGNGVSTTAISRCFNKASITGTGSYVGGIAGSAYLIETSYNMSAVKGGGNIVGGIVGQLLYGVDTCYNKGSVIDIMSSMHVGGLVGKGNQSGIYIVDSFNEGDVKTNSSRTGGVCGTLLIADGVAHSARIERCYNSGSVSTNVRYEDALIAGIVSQIRGVDITNVYNVGTVTGQNSAGIAWTMSHGSTIQYAYNGGSMTGSNHTQSIANSVTDSTIDNSNVFYLTGSSAQVSYGTVKTLEELRSAATVTALNQGQSTVWKSGSIKTNNFPDLILTAMEEVEAEVLEITTYEELKALATSVNGGNDYSGIVVNLMNNIDCNGSSSNKFTPIGNSSKMFQGTFNGNGHTISNIYIDTNASYTGLFGQTGSSAIIKNLTITGFVKGKSNTGVFVGYNGGGKITGCTNYANVDGTTEENKYIGGIAGQNRGTISSCENYGKINAEWRDYAGGICGYSDSNISIMSCVNRGNVIGSSYIAGIVGSGVLVEYSYNMGTVYATGSYAGGIAGKITTGIDHCYNKGSVIDWYSCSYVGGIAGRAESTGVFILDSYNEGSVDTNGTSIGGICGSMTSTSGKGVIERCYNIGAVTTGPDYTDKSVGGIAGSVNRIDIKNVFNQGPVMSKKGAGIIWSLSNSTLDYAYNVGASVPSSATMPIVGTMSSASVGSHVYYMQGTYFKPGSVGTRKSLEEMRDVSLIALLNNGNSEGNIWQSGGEKFKDFPKLKLDSDIEVEGTTYEINSYADCITFVNAVNSGKTFAYDTINLNIDVELNSSTSNNLVPVGNAKNGFAGTFNGNGHTVSGINMSTSNECIGLFGHITGSAVVRDLTVSGSITGAKFTGGIVGLNESGTIINCVNNANVTTTSRFVGGIAGESKGGYIKYCENTGTITSSSDGYIGGIVGQTYGTRTIYYCKNSGRIEATGAYVGGIAGVGGLIEYCSNTGAINARKTHVGGICGILDLGVVRCYNTGTITDTNSCSKIGGIVGLAETTGVFIQECYNSGRVNTNGSDVGGIVGSFNSSDGVAIGKLQLCFNLGYISTNTSYTDSKVGGIGGNIQGCDIKNVYNLGNVVSQKGAGICWQFSKSSIAYMYNAGSITGSNNTKAIYNSASTGTTDTAHLFYLQGSPKSSTNVGTVKTAEELRAIAIVNTLNENDNNVWIQAPSNDVNMGFPMFEFYPDNFDTYFDDVGPMVTFNPNGNKPEGVSIEEAYEKSSASLVTLLDNAGGSGISRENSRYVLTTSLTKPSDSEFVNEFENMRGSAPVAIDDKNGAWYIWVKAEDQEGNVSYERSNAFYLDNTPPRGTISITSGVDGEDIVDVGGVNYAKVNRIKIYITATDNITPADQIQVAFVNADNATEFNAITDASLEFEDIPEEKVWDLNAGEGEHKVYIVLKDNAGNQTTYFTNIGG